MNIHITNHALQRIHEKIKTTKLDKDRLRKDITEKGKWWKDPKTEIYYCIVKKRYVCVFGQKGEINILVTIYPYKKRFNNRLKNYKPIKDIG